MTIALIIILLALWFLGYIQIPGFIIPNITLFQINNQDITLWNLLIFLVIIWAIGILPTPLRQIAFIVFIFWILSILGLLAIPGLSGILVFAIILGLIISLFGSFT